MKPRILGLDVPVFRLLPATIGMIAVVLMTKSFLLMRSVFVNGQTAALITSAQAGGAQAGGAQTGGAQTGGAQTGGHDAPTQVAKPPAASHGSQAAKPPGAYGAKPAGGHAAKPAAQEPPKPEEKPSVPEGPPPVSESEKAVLLELRERRQELEAREAGLSSRESTAAAAEKKLSSRVEELQGLQKKLESLDASRRQQEDSAWQGLVKVYETMKPRDAAVIFNDLAMPVLLPVLDRMKETKAAAILAAMQPEKAREVTTQLALTRSRAAAVETAGKPPPAPARPVPPGG